MAVSVENREQSPIVGQNAREHLSLPLFGCTALRIVSGIDVRSILLKDGKVLRKKWFHNLAGSGAVS